MGIKGPKNLKKFYMMVHSFWYYCPAFLNPSLGLSGTIYFTPHQAKFSVVLMNIFMCTRISRSCCIQQLIMTDCYMKLQGAFISQYLLLVNIFLLQVNGIFCKQNSLTRIFSLNNCVYEFMFTELYLIMFSIIKTLKLTVIPVIRCPVFKPH